MSQPFVHESPAVAQSEPEVPRFERVAALLAVTSFLTVLAIGLALYLVKFQVDGRIVTASLWAVAVGAVVVFFRIRPVSALTPTERMIRSKRQVSLLLGLLTGAALLGSIATAAELDTAQDWAMLAFIASSPIGVYFLVNVNFGIK